MHPDIIPIQTIRHAPSIQRQHAAQRQVPRPKTATQRSTIRPQQSAMQARVKSPNVHPDIIPTQTIQVVLPTLRQHAARRPALQPKIAVPVSPILPQRSVMQARAKSRNVRPIITPIRDIRHVQPIQPQPAAARQVPQQQTARPLQIQSLVHAVQANAPSASVHQVIT